MSVAVFNQRLNGVCFENLGKEDLLLKQGQVFAAESQVINMLLLERVLRYLCFGGS